MLPATAIFQTKRLIPDSINPPTKVRDPGTTARTVSPTPSIKSKSDRQTPTITIASAFSIGPQGTIRGRASDNNGIAEVRVDGQLVEVDKVGNFTAKTYVTEGRFNVSIQAVDLAGLSSLMSVRLDRAAVQTGSL